ncbi:MAG: hypothetical protein Q7S27_02665 [Nanoarchaeota archaeon]|nr:hypothetical protein [Nanoarchaeota archaeon]
MDDSIDKDNESEIRKALEEIIERTKKMEKRIEGILRRKQMEKATNE